MLDTREIEQILLEVVLGKPPTLKSEEARAMRAKLTREVAEIRRRGGVVEIPSEIPDADDA